MPKSNSSSSLKRAQPSLSPWRTIIWLLVAAVVVYMLFPQLRGVEPRVELSYSELKAQVKKGKVASVTIQDQQLRGTFEDTYADVSNEGADTTRYEAFVSTNPGYENEELISLFENNDVNVQAETTGNNWWIYALILLLPWILIFGYGAYVRSKMKGQGKAGIGGLFNLGKSKARRYHKTAATKTGFDDVAGLTTAKADLREIVDYLKNPGKFISLGAEIPKGILLMGPPGTGKTLLARAVAGEAGVPYFSVSGSEFIEMIVGVGASRVRDMFNTAKQSKPAIVFIDELDAIGKSRDAGPGGGHSEREQTLNQILSEMDGFEPHESVVVIGATNRPDVLDRALTRPGRFDRQIVLELPEKEARRRILQIHTQNVPMEKNVDLSTVAARTVGFSGADLRNLVNEAALLAGRRDKNKVGAAELEAAGDKIMLGRKRDARIEDPERRIIAYHEAGHALVGMFLPKADPLQKVTIVSRGRAMGATQQTPEIDRHNLSRQYLLARIAVSLAGRASEKLTFNEITNGAAQDLKQATGLAREMVCTWGMSDRLGAVTFALNDGQAGIAGRLGAQEEYSEHTRKIVDEEVRSIINAMEKRATEILSEHHQDLDKVAEALLDRETLENEDIKQLLQSRSQNKASGASSA